MRATKEPKRIELPREIWIGPGVIAEVAAACKRLCPGRRALVVADARTFELAGEKVKAELAEDGFTAGHALIERADARTVEEVEKLAAHSDFLLGVGGGSCIDVAKLASFQAGKPFLSVPTAASHDGMASPMASVKGLPRPTSVQAHSPIAVIADTLIIMRAPYRLLASGCGDLIANLTAVRDWELAHSLRGEPYSEYAAALSTMSAKMVMESAAVIRRHAEEGVRKVVKALMGSGVAIGIAGSSRPASGAEHLFSHALDMIAPEPALHGEQCGVGAIMMAYLQGEDWRGILDALHEVGAPTNAEELGIAPEYIIKALTIAHRVRPERYTILRDGLSRRAAERLAKATGVI